MNVYTADGAQLTPGLDFDTKTLRIDTAQESALYETAIGGFAAVKIRHRYDDLDGYDDQLLARWGITRNVVADPPPPVVRPDLPKSTVVERLIALGKVSNVMTALRSDDGLYALWFSPDWQTVYKDDERVIPILQEAGLTADEIAQVMA